MCSVYRLLLKSDKNKGNFSVLSGAAEVLKISGAHIERAGFASLPGKF